MPNKRKAGAGGNSKEAGVQKLWGGRFRESARKEVESFTASISFDHILYPHDIRQSRAHARMLADAGIISKADFKKIDAGLKTVLKGLDEGRLKFSTQYEDVHMNVEKLLGDEIGPVAGKLHTARSRNDQVSTVVRLYVREQIGALRGALRKLRLALAEAAEKHSEDILPGYTHMQNAQPTSLGHHLLAYYEMFTRDEARLADALKRTDVCPLGAGAMAGTALPIDREQTAKELGFASVARNSMDAVSDRDYIVEFVFCCSMVMTHLSRACEEWVLWMSGEFSFIDMPDAFCTGSSIMPHKKNLDVAEIIRGKTGRVNGALTALLTILKGLPLTYNSDLQEDKPALFDAAATAVRSAGLFADVVAATHFKTGNMAARLAGGFTTSVDLTDYLVRKGMPFRETHEAVGRLVAHCLKENKTLEDLTLEEFKTFSGKFEKDVFGCLSPAGSVRSKKSYGGPAPERVKAQARAARRALTKEAK